MVSLKNAVDFLFLGARLHCCVFRYPLTDQKQESHMFLHWILLALIQLEKHLILL